MSERRISQLPGEIGRDLHPAERSELVDVWAGLGEPSVPRMRDDSLAWEDLQRRIADGKTVRPQLDRRFALPRRRFIAIAIAASVLIAVSIALLENSRTTVITAEPGLMTQHRLPDGSSVVLNSGSTIEYRSRFHSGLVAERRREVRLHGEAIFDVAAGHQTFVVETPHARVTVEGTRFNVRAWTGAHDEGTSVTLLSGRVRVHSPDGSVALLEQPGDASRIDAVGEGMHLLSVDIDRAAAWTRRGFVMEDSPVGAILDELARRHAVTIETAADVDLAARMSVFYNSDAGVQTILQDISLARGLTFSRTSGGFLLETG
jgi:transmembrane sensor